MGLIDADMISNFDSTAAEAMENLDTDLERVGIELWIVRPNEPLREMLRVTGLTKRLGKENIYPTVRAAVIAFQEQFNTEWLIAGTLWVTGIRPLDFRKPRSRL